MRRTLAQSASAQTIERVLGYGPLTLDTELALIRALYSDELGSIFQFPGEYIDYAYDEDECGARSAPVGELRPGSTAGSHPEEPASEATEGNDAHPAHAGVSLADARELGWRLAQIEEGNVMRVSVMLAAACAAATGAAEEEAKRRQASLDGDVFDRMFGDRSYILAISFDSGDDRIVRKDRDVFGEIDIDTVDRAAAFVLPETPVLERWCLRSQSRGRVPGPQVLSRRNPVWRRA